MIDLDLEEELPLEELEAAATMYNHLCDGTFYQRQADAERWLRSKKRMFKTIVITHECGIRCLLCKGTGEGMVDSSTYQICKGSGFIGIEKTESTITVFFDDDGSINGIYDCYRCGCDLIPSIKEALDISEDSEVKDIGESGAKEA